MTGAKSIFILTVFFLPVCSCKKTKLEGDLTSLIGEWEWRYTLKGDNVCTPVVESDITTHSPSIDGYSYSLVFSAHITEQQLKIDVSALQSGLYLVTLIQDNNVLSKKLTVQND